MTIDPKFIFALISTFLNIVAYYPYIRDVLKHQTKPHSYTWLIWALTQGTATAALWYGGGNFGAISLTVGVILVVAVFLMSLRYGTTNITRSDSVILTLALLAILVWWQLSLPLIAVLMVSAIDGAGYFPTFRKSYAEPWSETILFWGTMGTAGVFALLALAEYNALTVTYLATITALNYCLMAFCYWRQRSVLPPTL